MSQLPYPDESEYLRGDADGILLHEWLLEVNGELFNPLIDGRTDLSSRQGPQRPSSAKLALGLTWLIRNFARVNHPVEIAVNDQALLLESVCSSLIHNICTLFEDRKGLSLFQFLSGTSEDASGFLHICAVQLLSRFPESLRDVVAESTALRSEEHT